MHNKWSYLLSVAGTFGLAVFTVHLCMTLLIGLEPIKAVEESLAALVFYFCGGLAVGNAVLNDLGLDKT